MNASTSVVADPTMRIPVSPKRPMKSVRVPVWEQQSWEWAKLRKIALRQMNKFIDLVPLVLRNEDLTAVNRMRVTCRRLEEILDLIYVKPRPGHIKKLRRRLKLCRRTLGKLRNCDTLLAVANNSIAAKRPDSEAWLALREHLQSIRAQTAAVTLEKIGRVNLSMPYLRMKRDFVFAGKKSAGTRYVNGAATHETSEVVYRRITRALDKHWREFTRLLEESRHDQGEHVIHSLRIAAKKLRYLVEVMMKLHIAGSAGALDWLKLLQRIIGVWHDLEIMERMLRKTARPINLRGELRDAGHIEHVIRHNRQIKKESTKTFFQMTRHSRDYAQVKQWVCKVLARHAVRTTMH